MKQTGPRTAPDREYVCTNCDRGFSTRMAQQIAMITDETAELMCSWCRHTDCYDAPDEADIERPPPVVDVRQSLENESSPTVDIEFEGGVIVQFRLGDDGIVRQETVDTDGTTLASRVARHDGPPTASPSVHGERLLETYRRYTVRGLGIQRPHLAVGLLEDY